MSYISRWMNSFGWIRRSGLMKKINDERLQLQNLKNIRILFIIQTIGIIGILGYDLITKGMDGMRENPLWFVLILTGVVSAYLSMSISVDNESSKKSPNKGMTISLIVIAIISIAVGVFVSLTDGYSPVNGIIIGGIIFICALVPSLYIYYLRMKRQD